MSRSSKYSSLHDYSVSGAHSYKTRSSSVNSPLALTPRGFSSGSLTSPLSSGTIFDYSAGLDQSYQTSSTSSRINGSAASTNQNASSSSQPATGRSRRDRDPEERTGTAPRSKFSAFLQERRRTLEAYEEDANRFLSSFRLPHGEPPKNAEVTGGRSASLSSRLPRQSAFDHSMMLSQKSTSVEKRRPSNDDVDPTQSEFIRRLLDAHNKVDQLLRSRGLNGEDERKFLRTVEEIPKIEEEPVYRYRRFRRPSIGSDSGLSTDSDSENSVKTIPENVPCEATPSTSNLLEEIAPDIPEFEADEEADLVAVVLTYRDFLSASLSISAPTPKRKKPLRRQKKVQEESEPEKKTEEKEATVDLSRRVQRCSAEICIQHVSFYQLAQALNQPAKVQERFCKVHFRITERSLRNMTTSAVLKATSKKLKVEKTIKLCKLPVAVPEPTRRLGVKRVHPPQVMKPPVQKSVVIPPQFSQFSRVIQRATEKFPSNVDSEITAARSNLRKVQFNRVISHAKLAVYHVSSEPVTTPEPTSTSPSKPQEPQVPEKAKPVKKVKKVSTKTVAVKGNSKPAVVKPKPERVRRS
uniref:Protein kinase domain-containing protein n=1 Tax=Steinernema glaseri TaxID=37863 RepID=A0A1I7ZIW0_9BILA